jgi:NAD(P)-dependent dehydrogenase (short-subunit alcohol dehydrogenase family)
MSDQHPISSGFGARSTALEVIDGVDLVGKTAIVTGGYSGLGLETVRALLMAGADVIAPARDTAKAEEALDGLLDEIDETGAAIGELIVGELDLADPASIDGFTSDILELGRPIEILINNAGVMACPLTRDERGYEMQFATNHLGHYQLTARLWVALAARGARVVSLSSTGHHIAPVDLDDPHFHRRAYDKWVAYGQSKTANSLFAVGLDARGKDHGVRAFAVHPGGIMTPLQRHLPHEEMIAFGWIDADGNVNEQFKSPEQGAATSIWAATSPDLSDLGGVYCEDCDIAQVWTEGVRYRGVKPWAIDPDAAAALWDASEAMTGVRLPV